MRYKKNMHTENKLTTNFKPMQGCTMKMKKIKKKMTSHNFLYSERSSLIDDYKSR